MWLLVRSSPAMLCRINQGSPSNAFPRVYKTFSNNCIISIPVPFSLNQSLYLWSSQACLWKVFSMLSITRPMCKHHFIKLVNITMSSPNIQLTSERFAPVFLSESRENFWSFVQYHPILSMYSWKLREIRWTQRSSLCPLLPWISTGHFCLYCLRNQGMKSREKERIFLFHRKSENVFDWEIRGLNFFLCMM